jgi:hypothetical protein
MKTFIKNIISFGILGIFIAVLLQIIISVKIVDETLNEVDNLEQTSKLNADLVFLGSSRCWVHFDPRFFDKTFNIKSINIGVDGHSEISMSILRLKDYLSRNRPPKFVILSFDPFMEAGSYKDNNNFIHKNFFARYSFLPNTKNLLFVNYFKFNSFERYIPLYSIFKYKLLDDCINIKSTKKYKRDINHLVDKKWDTIHNPITKELKNNYFTERQIFPIRNSLKELNMLCSDNNIKLLCIQTPVYKIIHDDEAFRRTKVICKNLNIPFIDLNIEPLRNNIKYFYSPSHLNKYGVEQMNQILRSEKTLASFLILKSSY